MSRSSIFFNVLLCIGFSFCHTPEYENKEKCKFKWTEVNYTARGRDIQLGNLSIYETEDVRPKRLLIAVYHIFGVSVNTKMFLDLLAEVYGFRIILPDFFRGNHWNLTNWPPTQPNYSNWKESVSYENVVRHDIANILKHYEKSDGITKFGIFGFCWGGLMSTLASTEFKNIKVAGLFHPSSLTTEIITNSGAPTYLIPAKDDPDMSQYFEILKKKFGDNCGHRRFNDVCHGFATGNGNFSDPLIFQRVEQTIDILGNFFVRNLPNQ